MTASRLDPATLVFVVIDVQERLFPALPEPVQKLLLKSLTCLAITAQQFAIPTLVSEQYPKGLGPTLPELSSILSRDEGPAQTIEKIEFSAMANEDFAAALAQTGRKHVILTGMEAHICVLQTALDLLATGHRVSVVIDGIASRRKLNWQNGCAAMEKAGAELSNAESLAFRCLGAAGSPQFKAISRSIR